MAQAPQQIGSPVSRVEGREKVTGRALFISRHHQRVRDFRRPRWPMRPKKVNNPRR
jgi:hypothetical protein